MFSNGFKAIETKNSNSNLLSSNSILKPSSGVVSASKLSTSTNTNINTSNGNDSNLKAVKVVIRLRPLLPSEKQTLSSSSLPLSSSPPICARVASPTCIELINHRNNSECIRYTFDSCLDENCSQKQLFDQEILPLLDKPLAGLNATVFAFGPTSSGKSFSMLGGESENTKGIIPRAVSKTFEMINNNSNINNNNNNNNNNLMETKYKVFFSYFEIYNEKVFDLFSSNRDELQLREDFDRNIIIAGLQEVGGKILFSL